MGITPFPRRPGRPRRKATYPEEVKEPSRSEAQDPATPEPQAPPPRVRPRHVWRVATTPRMIGFALVIVIAAVGCVMLGTWQLDRALAKSEQAQAAELAARLDAPPVPIADVVEPQTRFVQSMVGQRVIIEGEFEDPEFFVPHKFRPDPTDPKNKDLWTHGYWVLSPLRTADGAIMPVVRGWVEHDDPAYLNAGGTSATVIGALDGSDPAGAAASGHTIGAVSTGQLVNIWGGPIYAGYVIATDTDGVPAAGEGLPALEPAPTPVLEGGGLNLRNLAYAAEWFVFGGFAVAVWWRMVRDDSRELAQREASTGGQ